MLSEVSNGCGKGVGSTGGVAGTVGRACVVADAVESPGLADDVVVAGEEGKTIPEEVDVASACGSGCRFCGLHLCFITGESQ